MRDVQYDAKGRALHATAGCVTCDVSADANEACDGS
jgi:hypothetical protein